MKKSNEKLIDLDIAVIRALNLFSKEKIPKISIKFRRPLVVGSGNALVAGRILFDEKDSIFADEGNYKNKLKRIDGAVLISASGGKHSPGIAKYLKKKKIKTILLTNNENALASEFVSKFYVFPKNKEPYTYNTSSYLSMVLGKTKENSKDILKEVKKIKVPNLRKYDSYYFVIPRKYELVREMFLTKFDELFGSRITGRVFTIEQTKHAKTIVSSEKELFVYIGEKSEMFGEHKNHFHINPKTLNYGMLIALGYYFIGKIQKQNPDYFKRNIGRYVKEASKLFGQKIEVME